MQASDQAVLKALTSRPNAEETPNGESSDSRSIKNMKDCLGFALAVPKQVGTASQVISFLTFPALVEYPPSRGILENLAVIDRVCVRNCLKWRYN